MSTEESGHDGHDTIWVGVDGSEGGEAAVRYAAREASRTDAHLHLVHVVPLLAPLSPVLPRVPLDLDPFGRQVLRDAELFARLALPTGTISTSLHHGSRVDALVHAAREARLLVLGRRAVSTVERLLTGSLATTVATRSVGPVVVVPSDWAPDDEHGHVVAGVRSTRHSRDLVLRALRLAHDRGARVTLVHAWELSSVYDDLVAARVDAEDWSDRARAGIQESVADLLEGYPEVPVSVRVVHGQAARVLQQESAHADVLVLARRERAFPVGHLGGVGRALLRESRCPVEVVPPAGRQPEATDLVLERAGELRR